MSCFLFVFGQIVCARESLQTHIAGFVDFLLLCLWSTIAFTMHAVSKERIVQTQNFVFGRFSNFFFYPNETWTHPPTSNFFLDFWNFFNFAKPLRFTKNMDDHGERAICEMNVSYPISCIGYLPPSFWLWRVWRGSAIRSCDLPRCYSSLCGISWHCRV